MRRLNASLFREISLVVCLLAGLPLTHSGEISSAPDPGTNWTIYTLKQGETQVRVALEAGANAFSLQHRGVEYFRVPDDLKQLAGVSFGNPILYPMPNRVRGGQFTFGGKSYRFPAPPGASFMHGLVHSEPFELTGLRATNDEATLECRLRFVEMTRRWELFPWKHNFHIRIRVRDGVVQWEYEVENLDTNPLPFGVALHPYFVYQNGRAMTFLQVPATHWMEATAQLPSGEILPLDGHPLDSRKPVPLEGYRADDVFFGMRPDRPANVDFREVNRRVFFEASPEFTHLVVYTPDSPFFCIENQTCSTDAHNLASQGKDQVAHLQICPPNERRTGSVRYRIEAR